VDGCWFAGGTSIVTRRVRGCAMSGPVLLRLSGVTRVHGHGEAQVHALRGVDLEVRLGELVAVMGPSGSGTSPRLTRAGGLGAPSSGTVEVAGEQIDALVQNRRARLRRRGVGYVFQDFSLVPA